jgi:lipopolysaccharide/colanic/teichoic acid biosynthesis glycosyltransferase
LDEVFAWRKMTSEVLSADDFEYAARREYNLSVRSGRAFSLILLRPQASTAPDLAAIGEVLLERTRCSDVVGAMRGDTLAALLPETDGAGAWTLVDSIRAALPAGGEGVEVTVGSHPDDHSADERRGGGGDEEGRPGPPGNGSGGSGRSTQQRRDKAKAESRGEPAPIGSSTARPVEDVMGLFVQSISFSKRLIDVVVSAVLLLLLWPLFLFIGAAVVLTSKGGALYRQQRAGLGGRPFTFYKFRTMEEDAEENWAELISRNEQEGPVFKIADDPRITGVGRFLRRSSLDELPQLWNVLKGDMTLVGPRPPKVEEVSEYEPWQRQRLDVTGGLTCTWQVSGRSEIMFRDWMRMDINYVRSRGAWVDAKLLLRTVGAVLTGRGAY